MDDRDCVYARLRDNYALRGWEGLPFGLLDRYTGGARFFDREAYRVLLRADGRSRIALDELSPKQLDVLDRLVDEGILALGGAPAEKSFSTWQDYRCFPARYIRIAQWSVTGLCATANIVALPDADDWVEPHCYDRLLGAPENASEADAAFCDIAAYHGAGERTAKNILEPGVYTGEQLRSEVMPRYFENKGHRLPISLATGVYRRDALLAALERTDTEIRLGEDLVTMFIFLSEAGSVVVEDFVGYHYEMHADGTCHTQGLDVLPSIARMYSCLQRELPDELWKRCEAQVVFHASRLADAMLERGLGFKPLRSVPLAPFACVPAGSRVAIWGAGRMGQAYRRQLSDDGYALVVAWVDELWEDARNCGLDVDEPSALAESDFDVVVLALEGPFRLRLACNALRRMGVAPERIVGPGNSVTL